MRGQTQVKGIKHFEDVRCLMIFRLACTLLVGYIVPWWGTLHDNKFCTHGVHISIFGNFCVQLVFVPDLYQIFSTMGIYSECTKFSGTYNDTLLCGETHTSQKQAERNQTDSETDP